VIHVAGSRHWVYGHRSGGFWAFGPRTQRPDTRHSEPDKILDPSAHGWSAECWRFARSSHRSRTDRMSQQIPVIRIHLEWDRGVGICCQVDMS
jgi:hypothetical protein